MDQELCKLDGKNRQWHRENPVHHDFNSETDEVKPASKQAEPEKKKVAKPAQLPGDPVLRFVLIDKGIITPDDLTATEKKLLAMGSIVTKSS